MKKNDRVSSIPTTMEFIMRIVYLVFANNTAYCEVVEEAPDSVMVDLKKKIWRDKHSVLNQDEPIGQGRYLGNSCGGAIGVYDLDDISQVSSMVHDAIESQRDHSNAD